MGRRMLKCGVKSFVIKELLREVILVFKRRG